jgi:malate dehydrogenase (oxaloacetate-decarboxylating)(NADP+)
MIPHAEREGIDLLNNPHLNKGSAFNLDERTAFHLRGLLPPRVFDQQEQATRFLNFLRRKNSDVEKYVELMDLQDRNENLFYRLLVDHLEELMPLVYTPTVGQACLDYGLIYRRPRGLFISAEDAGNIRGVLANWPQEDVRVIVVTDGERILGLGDLGAHGMGIPVGKIALYAACAGIHPEQCLPITLDVGTNNTALREDPFYLGMNQPRLRGKVYDDFMAEFVAAVQERYPKALLQFEDFGNANAFALLHEYRDKIRSFNDDIQGTASITLAGLYGALKIKKARLRNQRILFLGAGEAGIGIGDLIVKALVDEGMTLEEARQVCWFVDSKGLVTAQRDDLVEHKQRFAHQAPLIPSFEEAVEYLKPTAIIGVSGQPQTFTPAVLELMGLFNDRPIIFALSNPTSKSECTAAEAYQYTHGRAIFASGSPFPPTVLDGKTFVAGQANNVYVFPGIGLGVVASGARYVTDQMFTAAAQVIADMVTEEDLEIGRVFPALWRIRDVSLNIATAVAEIAYREGLATLTTPKDLHTHLREILYDPSY